VKKVIESQPWKDKFFPAVGYCNKIFKNHYRDFILMANLLLENDEDNRIKDLRDIPFIKESEKPYEFLLAIIL